MAKSTDWHGTRERLLRTTRWSLVRRAISGGASLDAWAAACWYPLYVWARRKDWAAADAADAVQDFLTKICTRGLLAQVDPSRGKLRTWLLTAFENHLATRFSRSRQLKRGGMAVHVSLDLKGLEDFYLKDMAVVIDPIQAYTRAWALSLMEEALMRLSDHFTAGGREELFEALLPALEQPYVDATYEEVAARLGLSGDALRQAALRFRQRYRRLLLDVASERLGITCEARLSEELRELLGS